MHKSRSGGGALLLVARRPQLGEAAALLGLQLGRWTRLGDAAVDHDEDAIAVHDRLEAVGDGEHGGGAELRLQRALDQGVGLAVDARRRLIEHEYPSVTQQRAAQAEELPLPHREVGAALLARPVEALLVLGDCALHAALAEAHPQLRVGVFAVRVDVRPQRAGEEHRILRDDGEATAQRGQRHARDVDAIDEDGDGAQLGDAEE